MVRWFLLLILLAAPAAAQDALPEDRARLALILDPLSAPPLEGQMILATIRGDYRVRIALEDLPIPRTASFDWVQLARDQWTEEQVDGLPTQVMRRRIAIFPRRPGELTFPAMGHALTIFTPSGGRAEHVVLSEPVRIDVGTAQGQPWFPVSAIEYSDEWSADPATLDLGVTVRRRVVIRALGATAPMMPSQPSLREPWLISFVSPEERSTELTPLGPLTTVVWEWSLRPKTGERGVLPAVTIPYFDVTKQSAGLIALEAKPIGVAAAPDAARAPAWRSTFTGLAFPVAGFLAGLVASFTLFGSGTRLRSRAEFRDMVRRIGIDPVLRRLRRAAARGDALALRREAIAASQGVPGETAAAISTALLPLDRRIFGQADAQAVDLRAVEGTVRGLLRRARR